MTAAKVMSLQDHLVDTQPLRHLLTHEIGGYFQNCITIPLKSKCRDIWIRLPRHKWPKTWEKIEDPVVPLERSLYGHPLAGLQWKRQFEEAVLELGWQKIPKWKCLFVHRKLGLFLSVHVDDIKMAGKKKNMALTWKKLLTNQHHFFTTCIWDALNVNAHQMKQSLTRKQRCLSHVFSAGATRKSAWQKPHAKTVAWSYDMEGHAQKCVERD